MLDDKVEEAGPFGKPSGVLRVGELKGKKVVFIARHGEGHWVDPTHIPYRANIHALKQCGVAKIFSVSAVGSMKEEIEAPLITSAPTHRYRISK